MNAKISVIIPTRNRPKLLRRALKSVYNQTRLPDEVIIVDDSETDFYSQNQNIVKECGQEGLIYIPNRNTRNLSGAINTGAEEAKYEYLAFLDDDDEWLPEYIERCLQKASSENLDFVLTGMMRIEDGHIIPDKIPPKWLETSIFLVKNPGMQGSNIFIKKDLFFKAGGFNERFPASTDRVFGVRISKVDAVRYSRICDRLVIHHRHSGKRLSSKNSSVRREAFKLFIEEFGSNLDKQEQLQFAIRVHQYWCINPEEIWEAVPRHIDLNSQDPVDKGLLKANITWLERESNPAILPVVFSKTLKELESLLETSKYDSRVVDTIQFISKQFEKEMLLYGVDDDRKNFLIALTTKDRPEKLKTLLRSLIRELELFCYKRYGLTRAHPVQVLIIENSEERESIIKNRVIINEYSSSIPITYTSKQEGKEFLALSKYPKTGNGIGMARTLLTLSIANKFHNMDNLIVWVVDDDLEFNNLALRSNNRLGIGHFYNQFQRIIEIEREQPNLDVGIGYYTNSPPVPSSSTFYVQLLDFNNNLQKISKLDQTSACSDELDCSGFNDIDYYYDLTRNPNGSLKNPFPILQKDGDEDIVDAIHSYLTDLEGIFQGINISRPLVLGQMNRFDNFEDAIVRGGNTVFFRPDCVFSYPYLDMEINGIFSRRSDTIWTILSRYLGNANIKIIPISLYHSRHDTYNVESKFSSDTIADFIGVVSYETVLYYIKKNLDIKDIAVEEIKSTMRKFWVKRLDVLKINLDRIKTVYNDILKTWSNARSQMDIDIQNRVDAFIRKCRTFITILEEDILLLEEWNTPASLNDMVKQIPYYIESWQKGIERVRGEGM